MTKPDGPQRSRVKPKRGIAHESGDLHRLLVDRVQDYAIFALDPGGYIMSWNSGAERLKGYTAAEAIGKHFSMFYPRERIDEGFPEFELRTAAATGRFEDEGWRVRKDGSLFWVNVVITALRNDDGELVGFAKVTRDLTERRNAELALRDSERIFRLLVESVKDYAIFMLDPTGRVATWNAGAERIKGYRPHEIIGHSFSEFYPADDVAAGKPERELSIATRTGKYEEEGWRVRQDGTRFWAHVLITAVRDPGGALIGFAKVTRDLTERRAAEEQALANARRAAIEEVARQAAEEREQALHALAEELRQRTKELEARTAELEVRNREARDAQQRADDANRAKSEFLASMSHELRTPLNAIGGYTDLLTMGLSGPVTPEQLEQLARIKHSQTHLLGIINDLLNFSRIEAGKLTYTFGAVSLYQVIDDVLKMMTPLADAGGLVFDDLDCPRHLMAWTDRSKLQQIIVNLMSNAVKFTGAGGRIAVAVHELAPKRAAIAIRDTGCGIPNNHLQLVFDPFVQVGRSLTTAHEGTGLGLAISRDLARALGGDILVDSTIGVGSTFTIIIPLAP